MSTTPQPMEKKPRPGSVTVAVWLQLLLAAALAVSAVVGFVYGSKANDAFEAELADQGFDIAEIPGNTANFGGGAGDLVFALVIVALLVVLAMLNAAGNRVGRILTWIFQPLVLICGAFLFAGQLFLAQFLQFAFDSSPNEDLQEVDVEALVDAVYGVYPGWSVLVDWVVVALATLGSILVIILLAVPSANAYFRKEAPTTYIPGAPTE
ncbi:hypothetical protein L0U85_05560 [Glycomyces sp. L485]|uniref:hypothetical protein n=1 Tax=Glycomyces sp. L485 TaxID=2909235 RepID=UPI001F4AD667|nr:hypothetical protein [Glycomyces sp. L485]MCH7230324.1 hypothetical protein [Glycomyces sp. L485]